MKWSWKFARVAGIDIYVHATFFILLVWVAVSYWTMSGDIAVAVSGVGFILVLFACVVLHEFGHALTARRFGISTEKITLLPIGGVASMERMPDDPKQEILVALAGPAVNLVIAILLWFWLSLNPSVVPVEQKPAELMFYGASFLQKLMWVNILLGVFNLLPAFPMDGGRVLRAALAMRMGHNQATQVAAKVGQGLALWLGFLGLLYNPFLVFIALFIWVGAAAEAGMSEVKSTLGNMQVGKAMLTDFQILSPHDTLEHVIELTLAGSQVEFPVMENGRMIGVLSQTDLLKGLEAEGKPGLVSRFMQTNVQSADVHEPLESVLQRLQTCHCPLISVTDAGRMVGIVNLNNILELISIQQALHESLIEGNWKA